MRNLGLAGVASVVVDVIVRPWIALSLSLHLGPGARTGAIWIEPNDVLHMLMALFVISVAHVSKAGAEIADDNQQIV